VDALLVSETQLWIGLAWVLANLPWLVASTSQFWRRGLASLIAYGVVMAVGYGLDAYRGQAHFLDIELLAISWPLFLTLGLPGLIYRYLWPHSHGHGDADVK
jgi:hypothetical protein